MNSSTKVRSWLVAAVLFAGAEARIFAMPPRYDEEVEFVTTAANRGNSEAQFLLGLRYSFGDGVREDSVAAARWWRVAADDGFVPAMRELGEFYLLQGSDWSQVGEKWLVTAAGRGDEESKDLLASLSAKGLLGGQSQRPGIRAEESPRTDEPPLIRFATERKTGVFPGDTPAELTAATMPILPVAEQNKPFQSDAPAASSSRGVFPVGWGLWVLGAVAVATLSSVWLGRRS